MPGCSEADCVGLDDAGKVVMVRRGDDDMGRLRAAFFVPYSVEKMRGLGIFKTQKHSK